MNRNENEAESFAGNFMAFGEEALFFEVPGNLFALHRSASIAVARPFYAFAVHPPQRVPAALNGFGLWNVLVLILMLIAYGWPLAQFAIEPSPTAIVHRIQ